MAVEFFQLNVDLSRKYKEDLHFYKIFILYSVHKAEKDSNAI